MKTDSNIFRTYGKILCFVHNRYIEMDYVPVLDRFLDDIKENSVIEYRGMTLYILSRTAKRSFVARVAMTGDLICLGPYCHRLFIPEDPLSSMKSIRVNPDLAKKILQRTNMNLMSAAALVNISRIYFFDWDI